MVIICVVVVVVELICVVVVGVEVIVGGTRRKTRPHRWVPWPPSSRPRRR
jgi:hypothetical protein